MKPGLFALPAALRTASVALTALLLACGADPTPDEDADIAIDLAGQVDAGDTASFDTCPPPAVPPGQVRVRPIACDADVVVGFRAAARVGDLVFENARSRFVLRTGAHGSAMAGLVGGDLVDAVLVGPDGKQQGIDSLREIVPLVGFWMVQPQHIDVISDGHDGAARVRVSGPLTPMPLVYAFLMLSAPAAEVTHEYVLYPDTPAIEIRTTVTPTSGKDLSTIVADATFWGGEVALYRPTAGFGAPATGIPVTTLGFARTYANDLVLPYALKYEAPVSSINTAGLQAFVLTSPPHAQPRTYVRRLAVGGVGGPDLAGAMAAAQQPDAPHVALQGAVLGMWPGIEVELLDDKNGPLTRCLPSADGAFACPAPPQAVAARTLWVGNGNGETGGLDQVDAASKKPLLPAGPGQVKVTLSAPVPARLKVAVTDDAKQPIPFRFTAQAVQPTGLVERTFHGTDGAATFLMPPGKWNVWLHHGPEWSEHTAQVTLVPGQETSLSAQLQHVVDTDGWLAMDSHVHAEHSADSVVPNQLRLRDALAEGIDYAIATDHDHVTDYRPWLKASGLEGRVTIASGVEVSTAHLGHFAVWPIQPDPNLAAGGAVPWFGKEAEDLLAEMRAGDPKRVLQCNHPRGSQSYLDGIDYDPAKTPDKLLAFDAMELINGKRFDDTTEVLGDWYGLFARGLRITGVGSSDTHTLSAGIGRGRTWVWLGKDAKGEWLDRQGKFTPAEVDQRLKAGHAVASTGPLLVLTLSGPDGEAAMVGELLQLPPGTKVTVRATVQATQWLPLGTLEVAADGVVAASKSVADTPLVAGRRQAVLETETTVGALGSSQVRWTAVLRPGANPTSPGQVRPVWAIANPVFLTAK
ncbi:MAG: CehA/McbA family metallohydrolase [Myxococcota bacterium]